MILLIFTPLLFILSLSAEAYVLTVFEDRYGENIVRIQREAIVLWVRETKYILYDSMRKENNYVTHLSDEDIIHILRNKYSAEASDLYELELEPYMERVRKLNNMTNSTLEPIVERAVDVRAENEIAKKPHLEETKKSFKKFTLKPKPKKPYVEIPGHDRLP